jgi:acyl-[acyl-carrier-protein]-phospholipid O-acyltransferase / long-chain-fatty-acid--[acyl-carrier-protein] ligase
MRKQRSRGFVIMSIQQPVAFDAAKARHSLFDGLIEASRRFGAGKPVLEDPERAVLTYRRLILASLVLAGKFKRFTQRGENVGVLLPNVNGVAVTLFGLAAIGRRAAMLNFTAGVKNLRAAVLLAGIRTILTSRRFVEQARLDEVVAALSDVEHADGKRVTVVYLDDLRGTISTWDKLLAALRTRRATAFHARFKVTPEEPAVVLFTSGSEGLPKGVVLSGANLIANAMQIAAHAGPLFTPGDTVFNPLPVFHSFGLTAGMLTGLFSGMKVVLYPSPLHYRQVPKLIGESKATVLFSTDTFLQGYARAAEAGDLASVRYVVAGAERVREETRRLWEPYGTTILEGYGCTECAPVLACNLPEANKAGSVGLFLPGISHRLDPVEGIAEGGKLVVSGPNVMLGYLLADKPGEVIAPPGGWHDTGDIVTVERGVITIKGRAKRFAKIGGEMISLAAVETMLSSLWPEATHVVVALPDAKKGEQLVLMTDKPDADKAVLLKAARADERA